MKKILVACLTLFTLAACGQKYTLVSEPQTPIIEGTNVSYTKQDFFDDLQNNDYTGIVLSSIMEKMALLEGLTEEEITSQVNETFEAQKVMYGDQFPMLMNYYGGEEQFRIILRSNVIASYLSDKYFEENFEDLKTKYTPVKAKVVYFNDLETAQTVLEQINEGKTIEMAAAENGYQSQVVETVYTDKSDISLQVKSFITTATEPTLSNVILDTITETAADGTVNSTERYYIAQVTNVDVETFKDEFFATILETEDIDEIINTYIVKYNVEVHDQKTYELLSQRFSGIK